MNTDEVAVKNKNQRIARTIHPVKADQNGSLPTEIEVLKAGIWRTPYHGDFMITSEDLDEYVENFKKGVGLVENIGAPVDFSHENDKLAAAWITELYVLNDTLMGKIEWTAAGTDAISGGNYKCFSPEFYPKGRGGWQNPEDYDDFIENVLVGGGLTNKPLFKGLAPVRASASSNDGNIEDTNNVIYIKASEKENTMELATVRAKSAEELTEAEKDFLAQNKTELNAEEQVKFGFEEAKVETKEEVAPVAPVATVEAPVAEVTAPVEAELATAGVSASAIAGLKDGKSVIIASERLERLEKTATEYQTEKATNFVEEHIARGAIKADQKGNWVTKVMADEGIKELVKALPSNEVLASEVGSSEKSSDTKLASEIIVEKANAVVTASEGKTVLSEAIKQVRKADVELAARADKGE